MGRLKPHPESLVVGALLTVLVALGQISTSVYIPSLPSLVEALSTDVGRVNLTLSVFLAGFALSHLIYGPLSDRYGRRPVLLAGVMLYLAASVACALAPSIEALIVGRFAQSIGAGVGPVVGRAIVRDVYGPGRSAKALAYIGVAFAISPAVTPIIGGYLHVWFGWRANFHFLALVATLVLVSVWMMLAETNVETNGKAERVNGVAATYWLLLRNPAFLGYALAVALIFGGLMAFTAAAPFLFIETLGMSPDRFGLVIIFNIFGFLAGTLAAGKLSTPGNTRAMALAGLALCLAGGVAMAVMAATLPLSAAAIIGPMMAFLAGMGLVFPNCMAGAMAPFPRDAGAASALMGAVQMSLAAAASTLAGRLAFETALPLSLLIATLCLTALIAFVALAGRQAG